MSTGDDTRDRVIRLEAEVETLIAIQAANTKKLDEMHALFLQAKGARWAIITMAAVGGFISAKLSAFLPVLTK